MLEKGNFTFTMIKPVAVKRGDIGSIIQIMEEKGFRIAAIKKIAVGEKYSLSNIGMRRPGSGLPASMMNEIIGSKATRTINKADSR